MPIYEYCCLKCDHIYELMHGMNEKPKKKCPICNHKKAKKIISFFSVNDDRPSWDKHEDIRRYINKMQPKKIKDEKSGVSKNFPKGGV